MIETLTIRTPRQGLYNITADIARVVRTTELEEGLCTVFIKHTSASLVIHENADPSAKHDLERWLDKLVPEEEGDFTHTIEGLDDMPAHIKSVLTNASISIPVVSGKMVLGTWQGIYLWEHRQGRHTRSVIVHLS